MRNLSLACERVGSLAGVGSDVDTASICVHSPSQRLFVVSCGGDGTAPYELVSYDLLELSVRERTPLDLGSDGSSEVRSCRYLPEHESVCIAFSCGTIVLVPVFRSLSESTSATATVVGSVEDGIAGACWSPDEELLALFTTSGSLLLLSSEFDVLCDDACCCSLPLSKAALSWRGDSQYFSAMLEPSDACERRRLHVFERSGAMHSTSAAAAWSSTAVAWRACGDLLAAPLQQHALGLYERNGLQHGQVPLERQAHELAFSADDDLLGVRTDIGVELYSRNNYHWYRKYVVRSHALLAFAFDPEDALSLVLVERHPDPQQRRQAVVVRSLQFSRAVATAGAARLCAVVDGSSVLLTPVGRCLMPPPLYASRAQCDASVCAVALRAQDGALATLLDDGTVNVFDDVASLHRTMPPSAPPHLPSRRLPPSGTLSVRLLHWLDADRLVLIGAVVDSATDELLELDLSSGAMRVVPLPSRVVALHSSSDEVLLQFVDGRVFVYEASAASVTSMGAFPSACPTFAPCTLAGERVLVGLDRRSNLYVNSHLLSQRCSSFALHPTALLFTNAGPQNVLYCLDRSRSLSASLASSDPHAQRLVERGSLLVAACPGSDRVVLQMPRGNLEGVFPRALLLRSMGSLLARRRYAEALRCARTHRLDLNLLYDSAPTRFVADVDRFVADVDDVKLLNEFIATLRAENVCKSVFPDYRPHLDEQEEEQEEEDRYSLRSLRVHDGPAVAEPDEELEAAAVVEAPSEGERKVHVACAALLGAFERLDRGRFVLCSISALCRTRDLEGALRLVKAVRDRQLESSVTAHDALSFAIFLADVATLYDAALGLYDVELALMVAQQSQLDPKEYMRDLDALQALPELERRAAIDVRLGRVLSAIRHLHRAGEHKLPELLDLAADASNSDAVFVPTLALFARHSPPWTAVVRARARLLRDDRADFRAAGELFALVHDASAAIDAFVRAGAVQRAFDLALVDGDAASLRELAYAAVCSIEDDGARCAEAAALLVEYADDVEAAVELLLRHDRFEHAARVARRAARHDLLETELRPRLVAFAAEQLVLLRSRRQRYEQCCERLRRLRRRRDYQVAQDGEEDGSGGGDGPDTESMSSALSAFSLSSQMSVGSWVSSTLSGVARKKDKPRRARKSKMREGDPREEPFLLKQLRNLTPTVDDCRDVGRALHSLVAFHMLDEAAALQRGFNAFLRLVGRQEAKPMCRFDRRPLECWPQELHADGRRPDLGSPAVHELWALPFLDDDDDLGDDEAAPQHTNDKDIDNDDDAHQISLFD